MDATIAVMPGDGIGPEVMTEALRCLDAVAARFGHHFDYRHALVGGAAYDKHGSHFPEASRRICSESDTILFGSVGGPVGELHLPKWKGCEASSILALRKAFGFNINLRPVRILPGLEALSPLRADIVAKGVDVLFVRELLGDAYFGRHETRTENGARVAFDEARYDEHQIAAAARVAFKAAEKRRRRVHSVDKANVLDTSKLWRTVVREVAAEHPGIELIDILVDNAAMQIVRDPSQFDVVLTPNLFGDILSDAGAVLPGSLGLLTSASYNNEGFAMFEPPGGSAPDIAGTGTANPIAQILTAALMLRFAFELEAEAASIEDAVSDVLRRGLRTRDIMTPGGTIVGTSEMGRAISDRISHP